MGIQKKRLAAMILAMSLLVVGCGAKTSSPDTGSTGQEVTADTTTGAQEIGSNERETQAETQTETVQTDGKHEDNGQIASENETGSQIDVIEAGMEPVYGNEIKDGIYSIKADSSSSMFKITSCELTVKDGVMSAVMTMNGTGYLKLYMGTGEDAVKAEESEYIPFVETENGTHTYEVPVEALDMGIGCSAFSKKKEKWYDRVLAFRADSLPMEAFEEGKITTAESLNLEDGRYTAEVILEGGSGRVAVETPAVLRVEDGKVFATIVWGSSNYDYMKVNDEKFELIDTEGNSTFEIPVNGFDWRMPIIADTIAMSQPHEIEYTLTFDSATIKKAE